MDAEPRSQPALDPEGPIVDLANLHLARLEEGKPCPLCRRGVMEYDGMLVLRCSHCGYYGDGGCFT